MSLVEKWIRQKVNTDKLSDFVTNADVDSKISAAVPTVIDDTEIPRIIRKDVGFDEETEITAAGHYINYIINTFPANARINYNVKYMFNGEEITEVGYIQLYDYFWNSDKCLKVVPTERTLTTPIEMTCPISFNHCDDSIEHTTYEMYVLNFFLEHCDEVVSSDIELVLPKQKEGIYTAAQVDRIIADIMELVITSVDHMDDVYLDAREKKLQT